jgi:hypothetical protein
MENLEGYSCINDEVLTYIPCVGFGHVSCVVVALN